MLTALHHHPRFHHPPQPYLRYHLLQVLVLLFLDKRQVWVVEGGVHGVVPVVRRPGLGIKNYLLLFLIKRWLVVVLVAAGRNTNHPGGFGTGGMAPGLRSREPSPAIPTQTFLLALINFKIEFITCSL